MQWNQFDNVSFDKFDCDAGAIQMAMSCYFILNHFTPINTPTQSYTLMHLKQCKFVDIVLNYKQMLNQFIASKLWKIIRLFFFIRLNLIFFFLKQMIKILSRRQPLRMVSLSILIIGSLLCEIFYHTVQFIDSICVNEGKL